MSPPKCVLPLTPQSSWLIVLLTVNVSPRLVNGLIGRVVSTSEECVDVYFHGIFETHAISRSSYYQFLEGKTIFVCKQFPLTLAYALTIHKCRGMTLTNAVVDCAGAFDPGQVPVALGRVRSPDDLTVLNFRRGYCPPHPSVCVFKLCLMLHAVKQPMWVHIRYIL